MKGFNKCTLMGNLTKDPELRTTQNGKSVASFTLAINKKWGDKETVDFIDCVAWGKSGELIAQYLSRGNALLVDGRLNKRSWEQNGETKYRTEVVVNDFNFISTENKAANVRVNDEEEPVDLSDIPF